MSSNATVQLPPTEVDIRSQVGDTYYIYSSNLSLTQADIPYALPQAGQKYPLAKYKIHIQADTVTLNGTLVNRGKDFSLVARRIIVASPTVIDVSGPDPTGKDFAPGDTPQQLDTSAGATGTKGADADNGLDAGNIFVFAESIETSATAGDSPLQLHAIGGRGGRGQDGHQGMQGQVGDVGPKWQDHHQDDDAPCFDVPSVGVTVDKDWMAAHIFNNSAYNSCRGGTGKTGGTGGLGGHGGTGGNGGKISCATVYSNRAAGANRPVTLKMLYDGSQYVDGGARGDSQGGSGASAFAQLASQKKLTVRLDIDDPAFKNFCNVRAESLTVALPDFAPDTGTLTLSLTHNGDSPFYTVDGFSRGRIGVDRWIQRWIVVHLQLSIELEAARAAQGFAPEGIKAPGEVGTLLFEHSEPCAVALLVAFWSIHAFRLFARVVDLEREDGEPVNDEARRFGVQGRGLVRQPARLEPGEEHAVDLFGQIVTKLVRPVDAAFYVGKFGIGDVRRARGVFDMPQIEVRAMLPCDQIEPLAGGAFACFRRLMPRNCQSVLKGAGFSGRKHRDAVLGLWSSLAADRSQKRVDGHIQQGPCGQSNKRRKA